MMLKWVATLVAVCGAAAAAEQEQGDWSFEASASVTVANADRFESRQTAFLEGAPVLVKLGMSAPDVPVNSPRGPSDMYRFNICGPLVVEVVPEGGLASFEPELEYVAQLTFVYVPSQSTRWFSATWGFMDSRMRSGRYLLKFKPTRMLLNIRSFEPAEATIEIRPAGDGTEKYALARQKARFCYWMGRLHKGETMLLDLDRDMPGYPETAEALAFYYEHVSAERSYEYFREFVRRLGAGRPRNPKQDKALSGKNRWELRQRYWPTITDYEKLCFARAALRAGVASTEAEGRALVDRLFNDAKAGKDTGELPKEYLEPLLRGPGPRAAGSGALLAAGVMTAVLLALGACVFLIATSRWRRARPDGSTS